MADEVLGEGDWSRQLRKGVLDLAILSRLQEGPVHGYALIASLKEGGLMASQGAEATIYQALQRLARQGLASATWATPDAAGRPRKMYAITAQGKAERQRMLAEWRSLGRAVARYLEEHA